MCGESAIPDAQSCAMTLDPSGVLTVTLVGLITCQAIYRGREQLMAHAGCILCLLVDLRRAHIGCCYQSVTDALGCHKTATRLALPAMLRASKFAGRLANMFADTAP